MIKENTSTSGDVKVPEIEYAVNVLENSVQCTIKTFETLRDRLNNVISPDVPREDSKGEGSLTTGYGQRLQSIRIQVEQLQSSIQNILNRLEL